MAHITRQDVRSYLATLADSEPTYLRSHEIADELDGSPKAVGQYLQQLEGNLTDLSIERWGRSKSTTWCVKVIDS